MRVRSLRRAERGDTIIEVLIAMAVASLVLGITYAIMNKNLQISRANQERTEAAKIVQAQLEALKNLSLYGRTTLNTVGVTTFYIDTSISIPENSVYNLPAMTGDTTNTPTFTGCTNGIYEYAIKRDATDIYLYRLFIKWDSVIKGQDNISMSYRI